MSIYGVSFDLVGKQPIVLLKTADGNQLPADLDRPSGGGGDPDEAAGGDRAAAAHPRPAREHPQRARGRGRARHRHRAARQHVPRLDHRAVQNGSELEIDSRSSDAIAVAVRAQAPIFAADEVIEESAIEFEGEDVNEEDIVDEFKQLPRPRLGRGLRRGRGRGRGEPSSTKTTTSRLRAATLSARRRSRARSC